MIGFPLHTTLSITEEITKGFERNKFQMRNNNQWSIGKYVPVHTNKPCFKIPQDMYIVHKLEKYSSLSWYMYHIFIDHL